MVVFAVVGFLLAFLWLDFRKFICVFLMVGVGFVRFYFSWDVPVNAISERQGYGVFRGCVVEEPDVRVDKVKYVVGARELHGDSGWREVSGNVLVNANRYPVYGYGECLTVKGKLEQPGKIEEFDYGSYLARYDIFSVVYRAEIEKSDQKMEQGFFGNILKLKNIFAEKLNGLFSEPHASFMAGLLLGSRKGIPEALMLNFNATGLTHIIAISGYNITLIIVLVSAMLGFLSRNKKIFFSIIFVILFVVFVGMSAAVVRAAIMGIIGLLALWFGRIYFVELSLLLAAFFMTLWNPKVLVYDVGFQLSCLATAGLIYCPEKIQSWFRWLPNSFGIREAMTMTVAAQIFALPVIVGTFERFSVIAPIANVFVLPFIPLAMVFGFFAVMFGFLSGFLGVVIGFCGYLILETVIFLVNFFAGLPLASIQITWWKWGISSLYYLLIVYVFIVCKKTEI